MLKINENNKLVIKDAKIPPTKPSIVLFGLTLINLFLPNALPTTYENISNDTIIKINKLKFKKNSSLNLIVMKKRNEINI